VHIRQLTIPDTYELTPVQHPDSRGVFLEWFARDNFEMETGHRLDLAQANCSVSTRGVVRGVHFADVPPGQAKYVTCVRGSVLDVVVDLRVGSATFGTWEGVRLDDRDRRAVYIAEGLGHAFMSLSDQATLVYICSEQYDPQREHTLHPFDPDLAIEWPGADHGQLSSRDAAAPGLQKLADEGRLPTYDACRDLYDRRRA
jgi:dTDP-4-dehydrorhamnose 3,5-epimerase